MSSTLGMRDEHVGRNKKRVQKKQDEKHSVQERTFTKWINMHLKRLDKFRPFPHRIFKLNNISKIKQVTVSLEKFPSTFSLMSLPCGSDSSGCSSPASPGDDIFGTLPSKGKRSSQNLKYRSTAIKTLLSWAQNCTAKYGVEIHDFGKSWRSGLAFLALVKFFCPQFVDMRKALSSEPRLNMETAFTAANEWLGIPPLLDPDDIAVNSPDEQSVITYVAQFLECCPGHDEDCASADSSRGTPNLIERSDRQWTDSVSCMLPSNISAETLRGLRKSSETSQEEQIYHTGDQDFSSATPSKHFLTMKSSSWSKEQSLSDRTGGQYCDSLAWKKCLIGSLEDDGNCSEASKEAVYAVSVLDSDEEDAYSYILELDHKAGLESNVDLELNRIMDGQGIEFASAFVSQGSKINSLCHFCETQRQLKPTDVLIRSGDDRSADIRVSQRDCDLEKSSPASDSLLMNQSGKKMPISSSDKLLEMDCSFKMKESIYSDVFNLTHNKDKIREDLFPGAVKDGLSDNDQYEQNSVLDRRVLDRITGEPAVSHTQRKGGLDLTHYEVDELHVLLFLWLIAYCILMEKRWENLLYSSVGLFFALGKIVRISHDLLSKD
ncbi:Calmin [Labeo rohita]|uniref:Calmin n=1 Tax=Labeo rohita TaxID=84645 RepID=A0ABQ8LMB0_LABRO|nr:Calmin [Labeo rohita]